jgi:hypothetical protein
MKSYITFCNENENFLKVVTYRYINKYVLRRHTSEFFEIIEYAHVTATTI